MTRLPSLAALRAFECVARHKSFTNAAEEMCVTIPAVSHHIKALETDCGRALFIRHHRSIELTKEGQSLFETTHSAFRDMQSAWKALSRQPETLKISSGLHFMASWLSPRLSKLQAALGDIVVDHETTFDKLDILRGEVDIAIRHSNDTPEGLFSQALQEVWWTPMMSPDLAAQVSEPTDIMKFPIIESKHPRDPKSHPTIEDWLLAYGVNDVSALAKPLAIPHTETAMNMASEGLGIKMCPNVLAHSWIEDRRLVAPFKIALKRKGSVFRLYCRNGEENTAPITALRQFLQNEFALMSTSLNAYIEEIIELPQVE